MSEPPPPPGSPRTGRAGVWQRGRTGLSDGLVMLPQPGLQEFVGQVVSSDDPNDLGQGGKDPRHRRANLLGQQRKQTWPARRITVSRGDRGPACRVLGQT